MFSVKKIHFFAVQKRESYKVLFHKAVKLSIVKTTGQPMVSFSMAQ